MKIPSELKKDAVTLESYPAHWHKSAPWLISAATLLGLMVIFHK